MIAQSRCKHPQQLGNRPFQRPAMAPPNRSPQKTLQKSLCNYYLTLSNSTSYDSLLLHDVPHPSLELAKEMSQAWSRSSQQLALTTEFCSDPEIPTRDSSTTLIEFGDWVAQQTTKRTPSLLPSAPVRSFDCRLLSPFSSEVSKSVERSSGNKRSTTPTRLDLLNIETGDFTKSQRTWSSSPTRSITPVPSLSHSHSFCSTVEDSPSSTSSSKSSHHLHRKAMDVSRRMSPVTMTRPKPSQRCPENDVSGTGRLSLLFPYNTTRAASAPLFRPHTGESFVDPSYEPFTPASENLKSINETSWFDWDDDEDEGSALARMKKSITDIRTTHNRNGIETGIHRRKLKKQNGLDNGLISLNEVDSSANITSITGLNSLPPIKKSRAMRASMPVDGFTIDRSNCFSPTSHLQDARPNVHEDSTETPVGRSQRRRPFSFGFAFTEHRARSPCPFASSHLATTSDLPVAPPSATRKRFSLNSFRKPSAPSSQESTRSNDKTRFSSWMKTIVRRS